MEEKVWKGGEGVMMRHNEVLGRAGYLVRSLTKGSMTAQRHVSQCSDCKRGV